MSAHVSYVCGQGGEHKGWARSDPHPAASHANVTYMKMLHTSQANVTYKQMLRQSGTYKPCKCYARAVNEDAYLHNAQLLITFISMVMMARKES